VRAFLLLSASLMTNGALAAPQFLAAKAGDLSAPQVVAPPSMQASAGAPDQSREAVALSWAAGSDVAAAPPPFVAQSREYSTQVSADELAAGISIHTTSPRALVRIQPLAGGGDAPREKLAIHPQSLLLSTANGKAFASGAGMEMLVTADKLNKAEMPFAEGTSAFRLHQDLGSGTFTLKAADAHGGTRYLINVVEPDSKLALTMQTDAPHYLHGQQLVVLPELVEQGGARHALGKLDGYVTSPGGRTFPIAFKAGPDGRLRAKLTLDADEAPQPGLWEVHASANTRVRGQSVLRSIRLAFGVAMPVARLDGSAAVVNLPGSVGVRLGVEVGAPGRYEARGLLYGMLGGSMKPLGVAHAAQWMEPGRQSLVLQYSAALLSGATGPFEVRDLHLLDQGRMGVLQRQQRALSIDERELVRTGAHAAGAAPQERIKLAPVNG
jgi:hypothetical protein